GNGQKPADASGQCPPGGKEVVEAQLADEEPIMKAVRTGWTRFVDEWKSGRINGVAKLALIVAAGYLVTHSLWLIPLATGAAIFYAIYYVVRLVVIENNTAPKPPPVVVQRPSRPATPASQEYRRQLLGGNIRRPSPPASPASPLSDVVPVPNAQDAITPPCVARARRRGSMAQTLAFLPPKSWRLRLEELTGSMLLSAVVAAAIGLVLSVVAGQMPKLEQFIWLVAVSTLGSWLVLIAGKFWESRPGEPVLRRFVLLLLGMALGAAAWAIKDLLLVQLTYDWRLPQPITRHYLNAQFYDGDGVPRLVGHMAYFAFLLMVIRWWKQADPLRPARMSIWAALMAGFWGWLLALVWPFPQPWGIVIAVAMSIAVQLASPWYAGRATA
ncbi:MAG TPA: hypothetical protein VFW87_12925, partial [Pirellulales bacterium]|nr:hypothetical protein [Pirellulales bacterium]